MVSEPFDRTLVEGCCELGSLLQKKTRFSRGCRVVPITRDDDFASDSGMRKCVEHLKSAADTLWFSAPCTGGSTWQYINLKKGPQTVAKIRLHWRLFKRLWSAFEIVASHALSVGARVFIEWPRHCAYWRQPKVSKFLQEHKFVFADFDGCMYGLVASKGTSAGTPIQKPWRVACSPGSSLPQLLNKRCDGSHTHTSCAGPNTLLTQSYTPAIADLVHRSIVVDIAMANKFANPDATAAPSACTLHYSGRSLMMVGIEEMEATAAISLAPSLALELAHLCANALRPAFNTVVGHVDV
jgi:hypothetical protein